MREIKFRGKRLDNGKWAYGHYIVYGGDSHCITQPQGGAKHSFVRNYEIDPETVGQFTGLCDKNGKEIYEGDIVCHQVPEKLSNNKLNLNRSITKEKFVEWSNFSCGFNLTNTDRPIYEVIGNIHQNPELTETKI